MDNCISSIYDFNVAIVFVSGHFFELSDSAYLDIFMKYTIPFAIISTIVSIHKQKKNKKEVD